MLESFLTQVKHPGASILEEPQFFGGLGHLRKADAWNGMLEADVLAHERLNLMKATC